MASDTSGSTSISVPDSLPSDSPGSSEGNPPTADPVDDAINTLREQQIRLHSEDGKILLTLPPEIDSEQENPACALTWAEISQQIKQRLHAGERLWQADTTVHLMTRDRLLDGRQLQEIADSLAEVQLRLERVFTSRRQTAVAAATAGYSVEQQSAIAQLNPSNTGSASALAEPLYLQTTLRSGADIQHNGTVIILGDLNPGSSVVADGDILVWGRLRGIAHAGAKGNARCLIMALQMEPTQLRIADFVARAPETPPDHQYYPEVAYVTPQGAIRIAKALDFYRSQTSGRENK
ncbi:septum site-determining protein MinC [Leptodesmis sichuanensis]|uniref:septum site-determining protein MinC n=1 Tax=Leptodesmis sichuanensis TaxID=2906798 RepID=UPI001F1A53F5|nr:septum site-determining protein MinC [Leptodesmis sichuanensis]UIE36859.1 septum site-determining protein MinC [Leptodesmis sichuanensis A121]